MARQVIISENADGTFDVVYEQVTHQTDATYELAVQSALLLFGEDVEITTGSAAPAAAPVPPAPVSPEPTTPA